MSSKELFEAARRAIPLPELWTRYGLPLSRAKDLRVATSYTPCCGHANRQDAGSLFIRRDGAWSWHCFRCGKGGSAIDLVVAMDHKTPLEAAKMLVGEVGGIRAITGNDPAPRKPRVTSAERMAAMASVTKKLLGIKSIDPKVRRYLNGLGEKERGLSDAVINEAHARGFMRTLPGIPDAADAWLRLNLTNDELQHSGLLGGRSKRPAAAYRPVVFFPPGNRCIEFRTIQKEPNGPKALQYGEQSHPLVWMPTGDVKKVLVVEGGFDVLACVDLGFATNTMILGLFGTGGWQPHWASAIAQKWPNATWQIGTDRDKSGDDAHPRIAEALDELGIKHERLRPWGTDDDWNETLLAARRSF